MIGNRYELLREGELRWSARRHGQQRQRERRQDRRKRPGSPGLDRGARSFDDEEQCHHGSAQTAAEAMILVVNRTGVMVVVGVGAGLVRGMGEDPPAGIVCGTRLVRRSVSLETLVELMKRWRQDPGEIEHQEKGCSASQTARPARLKNSTVHVWPPT